MTIETYRPLSFSQTGQRANNEDSLWPLPGFANEQSRLFIVCDGMGGADKGEVASRLVTDELVRYMAHYQQPVLDDSHLDRAMPGIATALQTYVRANVLVNRMGSTLALLQLHQQGATVAHLGDSRVFQIRKDTVIFQTRDHKQVNDMVDAGIISAQQAQTHPWRNRLSRAIVIDSEDAQKPAFGLESPNVVLLTDIRPGDYFFLCSDGVLEHVDEYTLGAVLNLTVSDDTKLNLLLQQCADVTKDNYSGHLIHIKAIDR